MMDPSAVLREIGGGLSGAVMVVQFLVIARLHRRNEELNDKLVGMAVQNGASSREMHSKTLEGMSALTTATQAANTTAQASLAALERQL